MGKQPGTVTSQDLDAIEHILLCGGERFERWEQLSSYGCQAQIDFTAVTSTGSIDTLSDIPHMKNLRDLALCSQNLSDLSPLSGCGVERLSLHRNQISDVTALGECPMLRQLDISGNPVSNLEALEQCGALWYLNAGGTQLETLESLTDVPLLGTLLLHDCPHLTDLSALPQMAQLNTLQLRPVATEQLAVIQSLTGLNCLGIWQAEGMVDLTPLSGLTRLNWLFVHTDGLSSLTGVETLLELEFLDLRSPMILDLEPLAGLSRLKVMTVVDLHPAGWETLSELPALEQINCLPEQQGPIRQILGDRAVEVKAGGG